MTDEESQEILHAALSTALVDSGVLEDDQILTGWVIAFECRAPDSPASAGQCYGPASATTWGAMGLLEWAHETIDSGLGPNAGSDD